MLQYCSFGCEILLRLVSILSPILDPKPIMHIFKIFKHHSTYSQVVQVSFNKVC